MKIQIYDYASYYTDLDTAVLNGALKRNAWGLLWGSLCGNQFLFSLLTEIMPKGRRLVFGKVGFDPEMVIAAAGRLAVIFTLD
ncbi:jg15092 [Pararge aegeria aegeria]|uniref:Jg15092 protein n=1 Tax=Pararge aegeria aegeria TaxID=348720 RepID=A0A8S4QIB3_9NEOP|nr:jg15092 [Pararge aegeria aegeria]